MEGDSKTAAPEHLIDRARPLLPLVVGLVAAVTSLLAITSRVLGGSRLQYLDYWRIFDSTVSDAGSFEFSNLLVLQNEHPVAFARVLYFLNFRLFAGSNVTLGVIVMGIVAVQIAVLQRHNPLTDRGPRLAFLLGTVALLFGSGGIHNFQFSMSGAAWLSANLAAILAFHLMIRSHALPAVLLGVIASASYGTGLLAWPPLAVLALGEKDGRIRRLAMVGAGWVLSWTVYAFLFERPPGRSFPLNPAGVVFRSLTALGVSLTSNVAVAIAAGALVVLVALLAVSRCESLTKGGMALALAMYGSLNTGLIAFSRSDFGDGAGIASRYASLSALAIIGVVGLVALSHRQAAVILMVTLGLLASSAGVPRLTSLENFDGQLRTNREATIATILATGEGYRPIFDSNIRPKLVAIEHYPFDGSFELDCGALGEPIELNPDVQTDRVLEETDSPDPELRRFEGFVGPNEPLPECLLVVSGGVVVGAGVVGGPLSNEDAPSGSVNFVALAPGEIDEPIRIAGTTADGATITYRWVSP